VWCGGKGGLTRELPNSESVGQVPNHLHIRTTLKTYVTALVSEPPSRPPQPLFSYLAAMTALDSEQSMFSDDDDDMPLASQSSRNGIVRNGHVATNGVGSGKAHVLDADGDTPMSDVDDDDVPLVGS
jgi:hypothetical protein